MLRVDPTECPTGACRQQAARFDEPQELAARSKRIQPGLRRRRYLLRFDDICPTMDWGVWSQIESALIERNLKPILAVVPDNHDETLKVRAPVTDFWERVHGWQSRGWTIGMHGYQHRYVSRCCGIVTARRKSEFAGIPAGEQENKLWQATHIFQRHGIRSRMWIAPGHSFDSITVSLLSKFGMDIISDGYFKFPIVCRKKVFWIPQQLSYFLPAPPGVWTVCHHINGWNPETINRFLQDLDRYAPEIGSVQEVLQEWSSLDPKWAWLCRRPRLSPLLMRCQLKLWTSWQTARAVPAESRGA
jgi:peptidoglycan/xylan/chitin deacetylase (PgdA/CDA1 family)